MARRRRRRPPWWLLVLTVVAAVAIGILLSSGRGPSKPRLAVRAAEVPAAVRAVEAKLGGTQRYTEVNAGVDVVNVFVAGPDGTEVPWQFGPSGLEGPAPSQAAGPDHPAFALDGVDVDRAERVAREAADQFPTATLTRFALRRAPDGTVVWSIGLRSTQGGLIEVTFAGDGRFLGADLR
jgi:hypothetical protein